MYRDTCMESNIPSRTCASRWWNRRGKIGSRINQILLFCFHYDPAKGKYQAAIFNTLKAAGSATVLLLGVFVITMLRRDFAAGRRP